MKVIFFFQPNVYKAIIFLLLSLSWIVPTGEVATCKICWEQYYGFPFTFVVLEKYGFGRSNYSYVLDSINISTLLLNLGILYFGACVIAHISNRFLQGSV